MFNNNNWLIIGYGNTLRNDDGVGQIIVKNIEKLMLNNVKCIYQHQLTIELVEKIKGFNKVIFVDASLDITEVHLIKLPRYNINNYQDYGHYCNPEYLLYLTELVYHQNPESFLIIIPIENINLGEKLSLLAEKGKEKALEIIKKIVLKVE